MTMALRVSFSSRLAKFSPTSPYASRITSRLALRQPTRLPIPSRHDFHSSTSHRSGSLFNLGGLATSRECQYFAKERGIPRTEFSPHLELIRSSEVDTQGAPGARKSSTSTVQPPVNTVFLLDDAILRIQRLEGTCQNLLEEAKARTREEHQRRDLWKVLAGAAAALSLIWAMTITTGFPIRESDTQILGAIENTESEEIADDAIRQQEPTDNMKALNPPNSSQDVIKDASRSSSILNRLFWAGKG